MTIAPDHSGFALPPRWRELVDLGFSVFPIRSRDKKPAGKWKQYQTERADMDTVRGWAARESNIGIATGAISGLIVLDLDNADAIAEAEAKGLPRTVTAHTGKGVHVYFRHPGHPIGNRAGLFPGCDVRGDGGYVVAPGSVHPSGALYRWGNPPGLFEFAPMPDWLAAMLAVDSTANDNFAAITLGTAYGLKALEDECATIRRATNGTQEETLNKAALRIGQLVAGEEIDGAHAHTHLVRAALDMANYDAANPWTLDDIAAKVGRGLADGGRTPRKAPEGARWKKDGSHDGQGECADPETGEVFTVDGDVSEDAIAQAFTDRFRYTLRFDHVARAWYEWDGTRWKRDGTDRAFNYARQIGRLLSRGDKGERGLRKASVAGGAERFARADPAHAVDSSVWDTDPMLLGTPAGTIDLRAGKMRAARPGDYITKQTSVAPDSGEPTLWLQFLRDALGADAGTIRLLQQWCGYCLTGLTSEHALFFIYGPGGNGKSVFLNTIAAIMGDYAVTAAMETFTASKFDRHSTELAMLAGARLVTASETEEGRVWAEAKVKQMTGGDPITARFMHKDNFTFRPQFKLTIAGNHAPALRNVDEAMRRRFNIVPFTVKPSNPDRQLEDKLREEHGKILAWAIAGCADWLANGLVRPDAVKEATADYFEAQDLFGQWIADCCEVGPGKWEQPTPLYNDWCSYAREAGEDPGAMKSFTESLQKRGFPSKRTGPKGRFYEGLALPPRPAKPHYSDGSDGQ